MSQYQAESTQTINPVDILDVMINDELVLQGAERDGYMITDAQVDQMIRQQRTYIEQQLEEPSLMLSLKLSFAITTE